MWSAIAGKYSVSILDRKSTRLNSSHLVISYAVFCLKKKKKRDSITRAHDAKTDGAPIGARTTTHPYAVTHVAHSRDAGATAQNGGARRAGAAQRHS